MIRNLESHLRCLFLCAQLFRIFRDKLISFKQYLCMLYVGPCMLPLGSALRIGTSYPSGNCANLSVEPEAMKLLNLPAETPLAQCAKVDVTLESLSITLRKTRKNYRMSLLAVCVKNDEL